MTGHDMSLPALLTYVQTLETYTQALETERDALKAKIEKVRGMRTTEGSPDPIARAWCEGSNMRLAAACVALEDALAAWKVR